MTFFPTVDWAAMARRKNAGVLPSPSAAREAELHFMNRLRSIR